MGAAFLLLMSAGIAGAQTYQTPEISDISSTADGELVMTVIIDRGSSRALMFPVINVYHADGTKMEIDEDFSLLETDEDAFWESGWSPNYLWDRTSLPIDVKITGLASGDASFYVTVEDRDRADATSDESAVVSTTVSGTEKDPVNVRIILSVNTSSSVEDEGAVTSVTAYPNPAVSTLRCGSPVETGSVNVRILDLRGEMVRESQENVSGGQCRLDVSGLVPGAYVAVLAGDAGQTQTKFVVAR